MKRRWQQWMTVSLMILCSIGLSSCIEVPGYPGIVAIDGNTAVIPVFRENGPLDADAIFIRDTNGIWTQQDKLNLVDRKSDELFGVSPALSGNTAIIGAPSFDRVPGSVYVFTRSPEGSWGQQAKLVASGGKADDLFGWSSTLFDDTAVVGAAWDGEHSGAAYVFNRDTRFRWKQRVKLLARDSKPNNEFGSAVALFGNTLVIGAPGDDERGESSGSAYIFTRTMGGQWKQLEKLLSRDGKAGALFGSTVAVYDTTVVIGAPSSGKKSINSGSVYVFTRNLRGKWEQQAKLQASDGVSNDEFGRCLALDGNTVLIGSVNSAYVFVRNAQGVWSQQARLLPKNRIIDEDATKQQEVNSVALSGDTALASLGDGRFYFFTRDWKGMWSEEAQIIGDRKNN